MEFDWALLFLIPYWAALIGIIGWGLCRASRREWWRIKYFGGSYLEIIWPARFGNFLKFLGGLALLFAVLFLFARSMAYLEGQPFWP